MPEDFLVNGKNTNCLRQPDRLTECFSVLHFAAKNLYLQRQIICTGYVLSVHYVMSNIYWVSYQTKLSTQIFLYCLLFLTNKGSRKKKSVFFTGPALNPSPPPLPLELSDHKKNFQNFIRALKNGLFS